MIEELYYIRCTVEDAAGGYALWWRPDGNGYTADLDRAGKFTLSAVRALTDRDTAVRVAFADRCAMRVVSSFEAKTLAGLESSR